MATIAEIRKQYPQYADMTDVQLADAMHARYYRDIPKDQFYQRVGIETSALRDIGGALVRGAGQVVALPGQLAGLVTGDMDNAVTRAGEAVQEFGQEIQTPAFLAQEQAAAQRVQQAEQEGGLLSGAGQQVREFFGSPLSVATGVAQTLPAMIGTGGAGLAGRAIAARLAGQAAARRGAVAGVAGGSGALVAGDAGSAVYDRVMAMPQETVAASPAYREAIAAGATPEDARQQAAVFAARRAAAIAAPIAMVTAPLGLESAALTGGLRSAVQGGVRGFLGEGAQEVVEEGSQAIAENVGAQAIDPNIDTLENVGGRTAAGLVLGGAMGGGGGAIGGALSRGESDVTETPTPEPDVAQTPAEPAQPGTPVDTAPADVPATPVPVPSPPPADGGAGRTVEIDGAPVEIAGVTIDGDGSAIIEDVDGGVRRMPVEDWQRISAPVEAEGVAAEPVVEAAPVTDEPTPITDQDFITANTPTREFDQAVRGKTLPQVAGYLAENATLPTVRKFMGRAQGVMDALERSGIGFEFAISDDRSGTSAQKMISDQPPTVRGGNRGRRKPDGSGGTIEVGLAGPRKMYPGVQEITAAHEIIHAVTIGAIQERASLPQNSRVRKAADGLAELRDIVAKDFIKRKPSINGAFIKDPYELIAYGLTDKPTQDYLKTIKTSTGNAFTDFVAYIARVLGLNKDDQNALMRLIELSEDLIPVAAQDIANVVAAERTRFRMGDQPGTVQDTTFRNEQAGLALPAETRTDAVKRGVVDRLGRLQTAEAVGQLESRDRSAYEAARRMDSKAAARVEDFDKRYFKPIVNIMKAAKISLNQMDWFLYARAAEARNARLEREQTEAVVRGLSEEQQADPDAVRAAIEAAYLDGSITDKASGISTAKAREMMRDYMERDNWPAYERIGNLFDAMHKERMELTVRNGQVGRETADYLMAAEPNYAPMKGRSDGSQDLSIADEDFDPIMGYGGTGISISVNEWRKAKGRTSLPFSPFGYAKSDAITSIVRGERNAVGQLLMDFLIGNPSSLWRVFSDRNPPRDSRGRPISITNQNPDYVIVKRGGRAFYLQIKDPLLIRAVKALDVDELRPLLNYALPRLVAGFTRTLARSFTSWNPEFFVVNYSRDIQSALLNIMSETDLPDGRARGAEIVKNFAKYATNRDHLKSIAAAEFDTERLNADPATRELYRQFKLDGGSVGWVSRENPREIAEKLKRDFDDLVLSQERFGPLTERQNRSKALQYYGRQTTRAGRQVLNVLENTNTVFENGIRFAAYRAALDAGLSRNQAAMLARESTVDFNRRGETSALINALFAFFNAGVQGAARTARALSNNPVKTGRFSRAQATVLAAMGATAAIAMYNAATSAEDDDGKLFYDKIPDYEKERAIVIMSPFDGESYIKLPIPYGFGFFPSSVTKIMDAVRLGETEKLPTEILNSLLQNFSPLQFNQGSSFFPSIAKAATPTALKPVTDIMLNENFMGKPIYNEPFDKSQSLASTPRFNTPEEYKVAAQFLNDITGGEGKVKGGLNVPAEGLQYIVDFLMGGVTGIYRSVGRTAESGDAAKAPVIRRFIGTPQDSRNVGEYYERATEAQSHAMEYRNKDTAEEREDFKRRHPVTMSPRVQQALSNTRKAERELKKQRTSIQENDALDAAEKKLRNEELKAKLDEVYVKFNRTYNEVERANR